MLLPGEEAATDFIGTDLSIAYVDVPDGGDMDVPVDGRELLHTSTNLPFTDAGGHQLYMENRKGIRGRAFGWHRVQVMAVHLLGAFTYDT